VVKKLTGGVGTLLKGNGVELLRGFARLAGPKEVEVNGERFAAKSLILATGSEPMTLPGFPFGEDVWDSTRALKVEEGLPKRLLVIGGGAVGLELGQVYRRLGAEVTLIEYMPEILPQGDPETAALLRRALEKEGIRVRTKTKAVGYEKKKDGLHVRLEPAEGGEGEEVVVDKVLVAVGRKPRTEGLGLEKAGVKVDERGFIQVNARMETSVPGVYAIGDAARPPLLAHKAMREGLIAAENAASKDSVFDYQVPSVVYTSPEWAGVGLTEEEARKAGYKVKVGKFPFSASGRALTLGGAEGMVKVVGDRGDRPSPRGLHRGPPGRGVHRRGRLGPGDGGHAHRPRPHRPSPPHPLGKPHGGGGGLPQAGHPHPEPLEKAQKPVKPRPQEDGKAQISREARPNVGAEKG